MLETLNSIVLLISCVQLSLKEYCSVHLRKKSSRNAYLIVLLWVAMYKGRG